MSKRSKAAGMEEHVHLSFVPKSRHYTHVELPIISFVLCCPRADTTNAPYDKKHGDYVTRLYNYFNYYTVT